MPFWTLRRKVVAAVTLMIALTFGWAAVVVAVALTGAHDEARSADAIAVLGAAQYNGRPSPVFRARLDHAAALYQRGLAPVVLVTGGVGSGDTVSESEVGRRYLLKAGLPEGAVVGLPAAASTSASLAGVAEWFSGKDDRRVLLVSDGFHMLRLRIIATRLGLQPFTSPAPNSPIRSNPRRNAAYSSPKASRSPSPGSSTAEGAHAARESPGLHRPSRASRRRHGAIPRRLHGGVGDHPPSRRRSDRAVRLRPTRGSRSPDPPDPSVPVCRRGAAVGDPGGHARPWRRSRGVRPSRTTRRGGGHRRPPAAADLHLDHARLH